MDRTLALIQDWIRKSSQKVSVIPKITQDEECNTFLGISEESVLGTLINHTGGLAVFDGVIRHLGGRNQYTLSIFDVNRITTHIPTRIPGVLIVAVDIYGGVFCISNNAELGKPGSMIYLPPENDHWYQMKIGHASFVKWSMTEAVKVFYKEFTRLPTVQNLRFDQILSYNPALWENGVNSKRISVSAVPVNMLLQKRISCLRKTKAQ